MTSTDASASATTLVAAHLLAAALTADDAAVDGAATFLLGPRRGDREARHDARAEILRRIAERHRVAPDLIHWSGERYLLLTRAADVHALHGAAIDDDAIDDAMAELDAGWVPLAVIDLDQATSSDLVFPEPIAVPARALDV